MRSGGIRAQALIAHANIAVHARSTSRTDIVCDDDGVDDDEVGDDGRIRVMLMRI